MKPMSLPCNRSSNNSRRSSISGDLVVAVASSTATEARHRMRQQAGHMMEGTNLKGTMMVMVRTDGNDADEILRRRNVADNDDDDDNRC